MKSLKEMKEHLRRRAVLSSQSTQLICLQFGLFHIWRWSCYFFKNSAMQTTSMKTNQGQPEDVFLCHLISFLAPALSGFIEEFPALKTDLVWFSMSLGGQLWECLKGAFSDKTFFLQSHSWWSMLPKVSPIFCLCFKEVNRWSTFFMMR